MTPETKKRAHILAAILIIAAAGAIWYFERGGNRSGVDGPGGQAACTLEAMQCPDGSYVGRTGPNCEFAACPESAARSTGGDTTGAVDTSGWKTYANVSSGFSLAYPPTWQINASADRENPVAILGNPISGMEVYPMDVYVIPNPQNLSASQYVDGWVAQQSQQEVGGLHFEKRYSIAIGSGAATTTAEELYNVFEYDRNGEQIFVKIGGAIVKFDFPVAAANPNLADPAANNAVAHQIVNTFTFDPVVGRFCGGIAAGQFQCPGGYSCQLDGTYPDAGGHCVKN